MNLKNKKILITCGPTWVPIDEMRVISNRSSGLLGKLAATEFAKQKAKVTVLEGPVLEPLNNKSIKIIKFLYYDELFSLLKKELRKKYDIVIHAAAVSDYKLKNGFKNKIRSDLKNLRLDLIPTRKVIDQIKKINPKIFLIGFKLESNLSEQNIKKAQKLFSGSKCELVIANCMKKNKYSGIILNNRLETIAAGKDRRSVLKKLISILETEY